MKIKDLQGFPEKIDALLYHHVCYGGTSVKIQDTWSDEKFLFCNKCGKKDCSTSEGQLTNTDDEKAFNQALSELGELEVSLDVGEIRQVIGELLGGHHDPIIKLIAQAIANSKKVVRIKEEI